MSRRAADMQGREPGFLWHGRLPVGHLTVIAGKPRMGKSTLGYRIAADADVPTLFITSEEVDDTVWLPRLLAAGVDPEKAWHHDEVAFTRNPADREYLFDLVDQYGIRLIVVDPIQNHLDASLSHDRACRSLLAPYMEEMRRRKIALLFEAHVLMSVKPNMDPMYAFPSGLRSQAKALFLFGPNPTLGADPELRILATVNFGIDVQPPSRQFEFATEGIEVVRLSGRGRIRREYGKWIDRGEVKISATQLLITLTPETKDRKMDRVGLELVDFLRQGKDGRMQPVSAIQKMVRELDPEVSWRTAQRVQDRMPEIEIVPDAKNKSRKWWSLTDEALANLDFADSMDDVTLTEADEVPDTIPEDWEKDDDDGS